MEEKALPSGAILRIGLAPFPEAKRLFQAVVGEIKTLNLDPERNVETDLMKEFFCMGFSSAAVDAALAPCLARSLYNNLKISDATFESELAREDYLQVCWEVAYANLRPFTKNLGLLLKAAFSQVAGAKAQPSAPTSDTKIGS